MKVLIVGSGGREHTLTWKIGQSDKVSKIYCAPGNGGTESIAENIDIEANDIESLVDFAREKEIDLTLVGPEDPLVAGIVDRFEEEGLKIFGVNKKSAQLEGSKIYSKNFMEKYQVPTAKYRVYTDFDQAKEEVYDFKCPIVIKADGLCAGKGVIIAESYEEAIENLDEFLNEGVFGQAGQKLIIEEFLYGVEASLLCFVSNGKLIPMESAKDYKKIYEGDEGPNTGGVGCFSPSPLFTEELKLRIRKEVLNSIEKGLEAEGLDFNGILFIGFMIDDKDINVLEFNVRFGDPETQVVLPRLDGDLFQLMNKCIDNDLEDSDLKWTEDQSMTVILASEGYPGAYEKGKEITFNNLDEETIVFHNGTKKENGKTYTNGGRVLSVTRLGKDLETIRDEVYKEVEKIDFENIYYRKDIGK